MGGASRNEKQRRQEAAAQRLAAAGIRVPPKKKSNNVPLIVVGVVVAVALVVGLTVFLTRGTGGGPVTPTYTATTTAGTVITAGSGPVAIDVYEDYLCPQCERFEERYGSEITTALNENKITVRFHSIAILDRLTEPAGYSTRAANAALCSVPAGIFPTFHKALFDAQPAERSAGLTDDALIALGVGAQGDFAGCVRGGSNTQAIGAATAAAAADPALQTDGNFGTPTVAINGAKVDLNDTNWLTNAIAAG